jgi:hypothetical protein
LDGEGRGSRGGTHDEGESMLFNVDCEEKRMSSVRNQEADLAGGAAEWQEYSQGPGLMYLKTPRLGRNFAMA